MTATRDRPDPALVAECFAENRERLLAIAQYLARNIAKGSSK